jgi:hypothetical protein
MIDVNELAEFGQFGGGELAGFDEVGGEAAGRTVEDVVDKLADHRLGSGGLRDGGRPLLAARGLFAADEAFVEHHAEHRGDRGGGDIALAAKCFTDDSERRRAAVPEDAEDFEFAVGGMGAGWAGHGGIGEWGMGSADAPKYLYLNFGVTISPD